jgi:hypothetical protein
VIAAMLASVIQNLAEIEKIAGHIGTEPLVVIVLAKEQLEAFLTRIS